MTFIERISAEYDAEVIRLQALLAATQADRAAWLSGIGTAPEPTTRKPRQRRPRKPRSVVDKPVPRAGDKRATRLRVGTVAPRPAEREAVANGERVPVDRVES